MPWNSWKKLPLPVIGMVHLWPLPGTPRSELSLLDIRDQALRDAEALVSGGVHGLMIENFGDTPFEPGCVPPATIAQLTWLLAEVKRLAATIPCGVNVLRNDALAALAVAAAAGGEFIRVNVLTGARVTDQGIIQGQAHELLRERKRLNAGAIQIWADVDVKHSAPLAPRPISDEVGDLVYRAHADAVIVTGRSTGAATSLDDLQQVITAAAGKPVIVGSGVSARNIANLRGKAAAVIVGSSLKVDGVATNGVDPQRVKELLSLLA
ncbi:Putative sgc region protein SgcQ [Anatilimnocola aggregata]|uniref:Sgc region protein SgcQ n=1 Tax=Anatilimnocola aggregata TaxID=2528021 RepID=A0A517YIS0_9BACT|nr:BtpA/SgcQ family protein [Anatilimnocola aggregata]QDU30127.1 Putative sgc region protein SgcQ [Anatilimnocola aggregata]